MIKTPLHTACYFQDMQRMFHAGAVAALAKGNLATARVFQRKASECYILSVQARDAYHLTTPAPRVVCSFCSTEPNPSSPSACKSVSEAKHCAWRQPSRLTTPAPRV